MNIKKVTSIEILDSRGFPTLKTFVHLENGVVGWAAIPSGASTGTYEAVELRDGDKKRYGGKGVLMAKHNVDVLLSDAVAGMNVFDQAALDRKMIETDGTPNKGKLGANAILSISLAAARAAALTKEQELYEYLMEFFGAKIVTLPIPMINVINGGKHAEQSSDFQEYMLIPYGFSKFSEALRASSEVFHILKKKLSASGMPTGVGDEGGYTLKCGTNKEPLQFLIDAITETGYVPGQEFGLGLDVAASEIYSNDTYNLTRDGKKMTREELGDYYVEMKKQFPLCSLEDGFAEDDWEGFSAFQKKLGSKIQTVGDDLYVTNSDRLRKGIAESATNAILIKVNQIGTLTETIETMQLAREAGMQCIVSHRSGETEDPFIADLVVAAGTGQIKTGSMSRSERLAKYNRLLEIEDREKELRPKQLKFYEFPYKTNGF
ncbi:MAG: phosphopyruvate hydratase [Patescibacteria group bacterium]|jgi:enolase